VVEQNGVLYRIETIQKFELLLENETNNYVIKLSQEINKAIEDVIQGDTNDKGEVFSVPKLVVKLEDPELEDNVDLFIQIVSKHLAVERYLQYIEVQKIYKEYKKNPNFRNHMTAFSTFESSNQNASMSNLS
jgi:hypothetical protein